MKNITSRFYFFSPMLAARLNCPAPPSRQMKCTSNNKHTKKCVSIPSGASLGGQTMGQIGWGGPSTGPTLLFGAAGVSAFRCEPLQAGCCCGGRGC